jgi:hypothetical protein
VQIGQEYSCLSKEVVRRCLIQRGGRANCKERRGA